MSRKLAVDNSKFDGLKWLIVCVLISMAVGGNAYYGAQPFAWRAIGILLVSMMVVFIALQTAKGQQAWSFMREARQELTKVVWPNRQETVQITLVVMGVVLVTGLLLWGVDSILLKLVAWLTGRGV